jgi:Nif-specific regulatory protein
MHMVAQATSGDSLVVIRGESGTGKDLLARMLHTATGRGFAPFVKVDCAARPLERLATRLFGHERDARTGACRRRLGAVEFAHRGTLLLDNVETLPPSLHAAVLGFLQSRTVDGRVGSMLQLDVRIVLTTRERLWSRVDELQLSQSPPVLRVLDLQLAPLRARPHHVGPLAEFLLARFNAWYDRDAKLSSEELRLLTAYSWPGNLRELESEIRRFVLAPEPRALSTHIRPAAAGRPASLGLQSA